MKISDIAEVINETEKEPSKSGIDVFVGLEHYDIAEPVIKRFGGTQMLSTAAKVFKKGDVLIARRNVYLQRAAMAPFSGLTSGDSIVLRVKEKLDTEETDHDTISKLLPFILNSVDFWDYANTNADGTMSKRLSPALLLDYEFDLPPIEEQKLRAEKLWAAYEVKQSYLKMIKATQEMVQSQFIEMFYNETHPVQQLTSHIEVLRGVSYKPSDVQEAATSSNSTILRSNNIYNGQINYDDVVFVDSDRVSDYQVVSEGDIVLCGSNGSKSLVGKAALIDSTPLHRTSFGAFCLGIRCKNTVLPKYLATYFQTSLYRNVIESLGSGSNILNIKPEHIYNLEIPIPTIEEQQRFVLVAEQADKSEFELKKSIEAIDAVIKSLINS